MSRRLTQILSYVCETPWAIHPAAATRMMGVINRRIEGTRLSQAEIDAATGVDRDAYEERRANAAASSSARGGAVAVVPVYGTILGRNWEFTQASHGGTTSAERLISTIQRLDADPAVSAIVLDVDSPGGSVANMPELAAAIAGAETHVVAQVNGMCCSGAYWLASQASELVATPSAEVGSIGVYRIHQDARERMVQDGIAVEIIRAGENKIAANPFEELTESARAALQKGVDEYHAMFVKDVAAGRGTTPKRVVSDFGDGNVFRAKEAAQRGMVDRIATLDETVARLHSGRRLSRNRAASAAVNPMEVLASVVESADVGLELDDAALAAAVARCDEPVAADAVPEPASATATATEVEIEIRRRRLAY